MIVNPLITKAYRKKDDFAVRKNKPNSNPILSAVGGFQMNLRLCYKMTYENNHNWTLSEYKPNQSLS